MELILLVIIQFSNSYFLILVKLSLKLHPIIDVYTFISIGLKDFNLSIKINHKANMVIFAVSHESLNGALGVSGGH